MNNMMIEAFLFNNPGSVEQALFTILFIGGGSALIYNVLKMFNVMEVKQ